MEALLREYLPHAPALGLYLAPEIPRPKLAAALGDYAPGVRPEEVLALYDATRLGSGKDGALFLADRLVFQNHNLQAPQTLRYGDIVRVEAKRLLLGGRKVELDVNRGRATVTEALDFSGQPGAAEFVERFLKEAMLRGAVADGAADGEASADPEAPAPPRTAAGTEVEVVVRTLDRLKAQGALAAPDHLRLLDLLRSL
ncbi:MAG: hypothetical protein R3181_05780 [Rubricoccaceae bacterium]|nr:hypothetical protein [Rubricoccaceae bacterium]